MEWKTWKEKKDQLQIIMAMLARVPSISLYISQAAVNSGELSSIPWTTHDFLRGLPMLIPN
jgi:hypothetical protein